MNNYEKVIVSKNGTRLLHNETDEDVLGHAWDWEIHLHSGI